MKNKVLIIEDDEDIVNMLKDYLTKESFEASTALNGKEGIQVFKKEEPDIVLLDVMMPIMNGYETLQEIRKFSEVPVIMLTAKGQQMDKVLGFNKGCDDYIVKPFDLVELVLRIRAILRRGNLSKKERVITYKDLEINEDEFSLLKDGINVKLTKKEFDILLLLLKHKGVIFSSKSIYESVWQEEYIESDNSVLTHIRNLREKLQDKVKDSKYIKTVWGVGYKVEKDF